MQEEGKRYANKGTFGIFIVLIFSGQISTNHCDTQFQGLSYMSDYVHYHINV